MPGLSVWPPPLAEFGRSYLSHPFLRLDGQEGQVDYAWYSNYTVRITSRAFLFAGKTCKLELDASLFPDGHFGDFAFASCAYRNGQEPHPPYKESLRSHLYSLVTPVINAHPTHALQALYVALSNTARGANAARLECNSRHRGHQFSVWHLTSNYTAPDVMHLAAAELLATTQPFTSSEDYTNFIIRYQHIEQSLAYDNSHADISVRLVKATQSADRLLRKESAIIKQDLLWQHRSSPLVKDLIQRAFQLDPFYNRMEFLNRLSYLRDPTTFSRPLVARCLALLRLRTYYEFATPQSNRQIDNDFHASGTIERQNLLDALAKQTTNLPAIQPDDTRLRRRLSLEHYSGAVDPTLPFDQALMQGGELVLGLLKSGNLNYDLPFLASEYSLYYPRLATLDEYRSDPALHRLVVGLRKAWASIVNGPAISQPLIPALPFSAEYVAKSPWLTSLASI